MFVVTRVEIRGIRYEMASVDGTKMTKTEVREFSTRICDSGHNRWFQNPQNTLEKIDKDEINCH